LLTTEVGKMYESWKQPIQLSRMVPCLDANGNKSTRRVTWRASADQLKPVLYGLKETEKWPKEGLPKVMHDGIVFWVNPLGKIKERDPDSHWRTWYKKQREGMHSRLMCNCPWHDCEKELSYGRLAQHMRVHYE